MDKGWEWVRLWLVGYNAFTQTRRQSMENRKGLSPVVIVILVIALLFGLFAGGTLWIVHQSILQVQHAFDPMVDFSRTVGTQVSQVMNPTPTVIPDPVTIIHSVRTLARLETIQYSVEKVITAETNQGIFAPLVGDRLLFVAHGSVIAGVDLARLEPEDLWVEGGVLYMRLPPAEVFVATLDNDKSYVYNRETGIFTWGDVNLETTARRAAESEILKAAVDDGILEHARQNAENYLSRLVRDLGYPDVIFPEPEPALTPTPAP